MPPTRRVFYSFHYKPDNWRVSTVRNIGAVEDNKPAEDNDWESITGRGEAAIKRWIDDQMSGRSCVVVLIGARTAGRKWINYEIEKAWHEGKGLLGVYIHNIKDAEGNQSTKGANPFANFVDENGTRLSSIVHAYNPPYTASTSVYSYIRENMADWIEEALDS